MKQTVSIGSVIAIFAVAMGTSVSVFSTVSTPAKLAMFALGIVAGIMIGRIATLQSIKSEA